MQPSRSFVLPTILMTIGIGMGTFASGVNAQSLNGIFGTRSSEHFFQSGIDRMEREIEILQDQSENDIAVLTIDESIENQRQELESDGLPTLPPADDRVEQNPVTTF